MANRDQGQLVDELEAFLALEAPFLANGLPEDADAEELEAAVLSRLAESCPELKAQDIHPDLTAEQAVDGFHHDLGALIRGFFRRQTIKQSITGEERLLLYRTMLLTREVDNHLKSCFDKKAVRWQGHPSPQKGFRSTGQEAIAGAALRLRRPPEWEPGAGYRGDVIGPMIRDLGAVLLFRPDPSLSILTQFGKDDTPLGGRDFHVGDLEWGVLPPAAPLAVSVQTLVGLAYAFRVKEEDRVCVSFIGDGGASLGEWHESVILAAAQRLPMVFVVENNQWALGTHVSEQTRARRFALRGAGYGMPGVTLFGNDPEEIASGVAWAAERAREGHGPCLLELVTYRRSGHAHHDDSRFQGVPESKIPGYERGRERLLWEAADPIDLYGLRLRDLGLLDDHREAELRAVTREVVQEAKRTAEAAPWPRPADYRSRVEAPRLERPSETGEAGATRRLSYDEAIRNALEELLAEDQRVVVLGEDVGGDYGGAFGVTRGLAKRFGRRRCLNTPLAESSILGCAVGAAVEGLLPVAEIQFADFLASGFNALVNNAAKTYWRWGRPVPMVVRLPAGAATGRDMPLLGGGPFHSQCPEMWLFRVPGLKIVAPATPRDAKGLLLAAIRDPNPVVFLEAKGLYGFFRSDLREEVPLGIGWETPLGRARVARPGSTLTLLTYGAMVWTALGAAEILAQEGIDCEVVDLRSLWPLDQEAIEESVKKTGRVLVLHEDTRRGGLAGELAAILSDRLFYWLDAPFRRVTAPDTPIPYSPPLEHDFLPNVNDVLTAARALAQE